MSLSEPFNEEQLKRALQTTITEFKDCCERKRNITDEMFDSLPVLKPVNYSNLIGSQENNDDEEGKTRLEDLFL